MWKDLTLEQKAEIMKMSVANGVTDINAIQRLYDDSVGHRFDDAGRIITLADLPKKYVQKYGHINVVTPKGIRMPLSQAYRDYNQTPINVNDVPGLTDYLIKQDQPDISEQAYIDKVAADRYVHQLGEERDKALIGLTAALTGGGALASGLALAPVATIGSTIGGIAGEKLFNTGYEKLTGNNWGQDVEKWTNGYIPAEYGEYLNPGMLVGGVAEEPLRKFIGRNAYKGFLALPQTKRAVEVAMRTSGMGNPLGGITEGMHELPKTKDGRQQLRNVFNYIVTGKKSETPYRTLSPRGDIYTGFQPTDVESFGDLNFPESAKEYIGNDYIDAFLYGKKVSPKVLDYMGTAGELDTSFNDYINKFYANKKNNIQVYVTPNEGLNRTTIPNENVSIVNSDGIVTSMPTKLPGLEVDASGHMRYIGEANIEGALRPVYKEADIYKFNPEEYMSRHIQPSRHNLTKWKTKLIEKGLKIVNDIGTPIITETPWYTFKDGGHLYKNAGPLNKKQAPKYRYGLIEQALVEGGAGGKFRVTSGRRKPNEAGNKGNSSAHTYTLDNGDPAAIDIVPVGITGQELLDIMTSPLMQSTLAKYGFDILNESSKEMMAQTNATGQHLHVGKGIKGQKGKGQIFGGSVWGTLSGNTGGMYASRGNSSYTNIPYSSTQSSEPFGVKAPKEEINPWVKFLAEMQQSTRPASPAQEEATSPTLTAQSSLTDFSSLNTDPRVEEAIQQANSQPALVYMPDITSDPLWNDTYDLFEPNTLANGGHLLRIGGPYSIEARSDNTTNVVRPVIIQRNEDIKAKNPKRQKLEQQKAKARKEANKITPANPRQASIGPYREKTALDKQGGRLYAEAEQRRKDAEDREQLGPAVQGLLGPTLPSYWLNVASAIKNRQVNNVVDALAAPYLSDSWSQRNPGKALVADIVAPSVLGGASKIVKGAGIPTPSNVKYSFGIPSFDELSNLYTRVANEYKAKQLSVINKAHDDVIEYLGSDKNIERLINAGATKEQAERIAFDMQQNAMATKGTIGLPNSSTALGEYEPDFKVNFKMDVPIWSNESRLRPTFEPEYIVREGLPLEDIYSIVVHELGGHGATLAYNPMYGIEDPKVQKLYKETIKQWSPSTEQVYNHNGLLQPSRKPEYMTLSETDPVEKRIRYLEDVDEYSARARASHILPSTTDMLDLYKYFTKETVDRLKKNVWTISPFLVGSGLAAKNK